MVHKSLALGFGVLPCFYPFYSFFKCPKLSTELHSSWQELYFPGSKTFLTLRLYFFSLDLHKFAEIHQYRASHLLALLSLSGRNNTNVQNRAARPAWDALLSHAGTAAVQQVETRLSGMNATHHCEKCPLPSHPRVQTDKCVSRGAQMLWECHPWGEGRQCRSSKSVVVLLIVLAGNSLLSERHGCAKYLIGKATAAPPKRAGFPVPIPTSELWDANQEGVHSNRDVCCRVGGEPALIRSKINPFLSTPTYWITRMSHPRWQGSKAASTAAFLWHQKDESMQAHVWCLRNCSNRICLTVSEMQN